VEKRSGGGGKLILVRHAAPKVIQEFPAHLWVLSDAGRAKCTLLAQHLADYYPDHIVASKELKATETGQIIARTLAKPFQVADGLHEHDRTNVGFFDAVSQFEAQVAAFFSNPDQLVFGRETANKAHERFRLAITGLLQARLGDNLAVVTHGTVMTLFIARQNNIDPFNFWRRLGLPAYVVLERPSMKIAQICESLD
jgi:broad specificity phosphatase PhoE